MNREELLKEKQRLIKTYLHIVSDYNNLIDTELSINSQIIKNLITEFKRVQHELKRTNRRLALLKNDSTAIDKLVEDIITLCIENFNIEGVHDPVGNAELSYSPKLLQYLKEVIINAIFSP